MKIKALSGITCLSPALAALALASAVAATLVAPANVTFIWNMPTDEPYTNLVYRLYGTTNLTLPEAQWPLLTVITNPSVTASGTNLAYSVAVQPGAWFFTLTVSNFWGESNFSVPAATPPVPPAFNNLRVVLGP